MVLHLHEGSVYTFASILLKARCESSWKSKCVPLLQRERLPRTLRVQLKPKIKRCLKSPKVRGLAVATLALVKLYEYN